MGWLIIAILGMLFFALLVWICGVKDACLSVYYSVKYLVMKLIEALVRIIWALIVSLRDYAFWFCWIMVSLLCFLAIPNELMIMGIIDIIFLLVLIRNMMPTIKDWHIKLKVQSIMYYLDRLLCFGNKDLTCYPQFWK